MFKLMIGGDHCLICEEIAALLADVPNIQVIAFADTSEEAILLAKKYKHMF